MTTKMMKGIIPICYILSGRLKIPVPIALANKVNIAALKAPLLMGPKALFKKGFLSSANELLIPSPVRRESEGSCYEGLFDIQVPFDIIKRKKLFLK